MAVPTNRDSDKFMLRLPDGLREEIKAAAEANNRSMNAEIVSAIEFWLKNRERRTGKFWSPPTEISDEVAQPADADEGDVHIINGPEDVEKAIAQMTKRYQADMRKALLAMMPSGQKAKK